MINFLQKNSRNFHFIAVVILAPIFFSGCFDSNLSKQKFQFSDSSASRQKDQSPSFEILRGPNSNSFASRGFEEDGIIWRRGNIAVKVTDKENGFSLVSNNQMVMVSFASSSALSKTMKDLSETVLFHKGTDAEDGFALFRPSGTEQLNFIAEQAHRSDGLGCGNLELVGSFPLLATSTYTPPRYLETIKLADIASLTDHPKAENIEASVQKLQDLGTRFHSHIKASQSPTMIKTMMSDAANDSISGFTVEEFEHTSEPLTSQNSVIAKIPGTNPELGTIIIGAHLDSINRLDQNDAPGADDDASGIGVLVEVIRSIAASDATFERTIEIHGYGAEEIGLIGSRDIATQYKTAGKQVDAMLQLDMVSWSKDPLSQTIYLITNDTSSILRRSLKDLLKTYLGGDYEELPLSAGTSDHKSWSSLGFHVVFPFEHPIDYNKSLHTTLDRVDIINNFGLATRFANLVLVFLGHHAGLVSSSEEYTTLIGVNPTFKDDIKVAVIPGDDLDNWYLGAATRTSVKRIETCVTSDVDSIICLTDLQNLPFAVTVDDRSFFINNEDNQLLLKSGEIRIFNGYDESDTLTFKRTVTLTQK